MPEQPERLPRQTPEVPAKGKRPPRLRPLTALLAAQFFSAFADNMILFITLAIIKLEGLPDHYLPLVQVAFLFAYVVLAPWVGRLADREAKSRILLIGNGVKMAGIALLLAGVDPAISYAVVGVGAVTYSPAKYGILPELTDSEAKLLKANSLIESFTILAILTGSVAGGILSDRSVPLALLACAALYGTSMALTLFIPSKAGDRTITIGLQAVPAFFSDIAQLWRLPACRFSLIGTGAFWLSSAVLRLVVIQWIPVTLAIMTNTSISLLISVTGVGIVLGAAVTPRLIRFQDYEKSRRYGVVMVAIIFTFLLIKTVPFTVAALLAVGFSGGVFIVPMNTVLQHEGHGSIGAGKTIAIQNFVENTLMFSGVALLTAATKAQVPLSPIIAATGVIMALFVGVLFTSYSGAARRSV
ncbi:lysophospholipid transporter LplT [Heliomicrobium undosum]|uniref:lysophospholipid transporter LplT n=1 Tax=Heliomicrobium undosum TaxID=121734 RepID=UPI001A9AB0A0|nr:lysophospholipid transporter LplT [Heliomicrobium undosum]